MIDKDKEGRYHQFGVVCPVVGNADNSTEMIVVCPKGSLVILLFCHFVFLLFSREFLLGLLGIS